MAKRVKISEEEKQQIYLNDKRYIAELEEQCKPVDGVVELKYPICITSMHNRKPSILDELDQFGNTEILVFVYDFEREMYNWLNKPNVTIISVPSEYLSIQKMRVYIQNYMGDRKYWTCDDDVKHVVIGNDKHKVPVCQALRMIEVFSEDKGFSVIGYSHAEMATKFWGGGMTADNYGSVNLLYDGAIINKAGLKYTGDVNVNEDIEFVINSHVCGIPVKVCNWGCLVCYEPSGGKRSLASNPEQHCHMQTSLYIKYGSWTRIALETRRGFTAKLRYGQIGQPKTWDEKLLALCKAEDNEGIKDYLMELKENK